MDSVEGKLDFGMEIGVWDVDRAAIPASILLFG